MNPRHSYGKIFNHNTTGSAALAYILFCSSNTCDRLAAVLPIPCSVISRCSYLTNNSNTGDEMINAKQYKDVLDGQGSVYIAHEDCPLRTRTSSNSELWVLRNHDGVAVYCHRCKDKGFYSLKNSHVYKDIHQHVTNNTTGFPTDFTLDIPIQYKTWFYQYGLTDADLREQRFGFSPSLGRVVMPVYDPITGDPVFYQARDTYTNRSPKYLSQKGAIKRPLIINNWKHADYRRPIVLVEDRISAIKVGKETHACCLFGTAANRIFLSRLAESYHTAVVWFDNDTAGIKSGRILKNQLSFIFERAIMIQTEKQPKEYSPDEIFKLLRKHRVC